MPPKALICMANYGNDPTETAIPYTRWAAAGLDITIATETGLPPQCDKKMLYGITQKLLGATKSVVDMYHVMESSCATMKTPVAWSDPSFSMDGFDIVLLPGGHDRGMRQYIDSESLHRHLAGYFPRTLKGRSSSGDGDGGVKVLAAICHGVMTLARTTIPVSNSDGKGKKSIIHDVQTTTLPAFMEGSAFWATRLFLGDYYKTYGVDAESTEMSVRNALDDPEKQWRTSNSMTSPFVVVDERYNYVSARFPGDAEAFADKVLAILGVQKS